MQAVKQAVPRAAAVRAVTTHPVACSVPGLHRVERQALYHHAPVRILLGAQGPLGLQEVVDLFIVDLGAQGEGPQCHLAWLGPWTWGQEWKGGCTSSSPTPVPTQARPHLQVAD